MLGNLIQAKCYTAASMHKAGCYKCHKQKQVNMKMYEQ